MKIRYLDRNWEAVGEKNVSVKYQLPDKAVLEYQHIVEIKPEKKLSFLDTIHISPFEDIVEFKKGIEQIFFLDVGKVLKNNFNISLCYEKIESDLNTLAILLDKELVENIEHGTLIPENCAGIEIDIIGVDYGMVFIRIPHDKKESYSILKFSKNSFCKNRHLAYFLLSGFFHRSSNIPINNN